MLYIDVSNVSLKRGCLARVCVETTFLCRNDSFPFSVTESLRQIPANQKTRRSNGKETDTESSYLYRNKSPNVVV